MTLSTLHRKNCKIVTFLQPFRKSSACYSFLFNCCLMVFEIGDAFAVAAKRAGREEAVAAGLDQIGTAGSECRYRNESGLGMNVIAAEEIDSIEFVGWVLVFFLFVVRL